MARKKKQRTTEEILNDLRKAAELTPEEKRMRKVKPPKKAEVQSVRG